VVNKDLPPFVSKLDFTTAERDRYSDEDEDIDDHATKIERFCHQHRPKILDNSEFLGRTQVDGEKQYIRFDDWIPPYLSLETQAAIRVLMEKARSPKDVPGYIYTYEIRDPGSRTIQLKTGRTTNLGRRLDQWWKQCSSKEQVLRGFYPGGIDPVSGEPSLLKGRIQGGDKALWCHRLERLIHLELADLCAYEPYLEPGWKSFEGGDILHNKNKNKPARPNAQTSDSGKKKDTGSISASSSNKPAAAAMGKGKPCPDCKKYHKEIFEYTRIKKGPYKGMEFEGIVEPVIDRWGQLMKYI